MARLKFYIYYFYSLAAISLWNGIPMNPKELENHTIIIKEQNGL
jgi:hypothetical protein